MDRLGQALREPLQDLPVPLRYAAIGGVALGVTGGLIGLIVGLRTYAPTAWAAIFEAGVPAALVGALLGLVVGSLTVMAHRVREN